MGQIHCFIKHYITLRIASKTWPQFQIYANTVKSSVAITSNLQSSASVTGCSCFYGVSPTNMINSVSCTGSSAGWIATITGLATKTKYYLQWVGTAPSAYVGAKSGIYTETTT